MSQTGSDPSERLDRPRVPLLDVGDMTSEQRELLGVDIESGEMGQAGLSLFRLAVQHPEALRRWKQIGFFANNLTELPDRDRELMILRMSWVHRSEFEWGQHHHKAVEAGITIDEIERIKVGTDAEEWTEWDRAVLEAIDGLMSDCMIPTPAWEVLTTRYPTETMIELVIFFGHYTIVSTLANTFGLGPAPGRTRFDGTTAP